MKRQPCLILTLRGGEYADEELHDLYELCTITEAALCRCRLQATAPSTKRARWSDQVAKTRYHE